MTVEAWYKAYEKGRNIPMSELRALSIARAPGIRVDGPSLREGDGFTRLAEFIRHGERPLVRLTLPNQLTIGRHRRIRDVVRKNGGQVFADPTGLPFEVDASGRVRLGPKSTLSPLPDQPVHLPNRP